MIVRVKFCVAFPPPLSTTWMVKLEGPAAVGVPVSAPAALSERPAGSDPLATDQVKPVAVPPDTASV